MGKNTKIICTVVPNPYKTKSSYSNDSKKYYFSVFLTPRLPESGKLIDYYEIANWHEFFDFFQGFEEKGILNEIIQARIANIVYKDKAGINPEHEYAIGNDINAVPFQVHFDATELNEIKKKAKKTDKINQKEIYQKFFNDTTPVSGWILDEGYPESKIQELFTLEDLKKYKAGSPLVKTEIFAKRSDAFLKDTAQHDVNEAEIDFKNKENQEFHKKLSIISNYPHLMRLTGWILDFYIDTSEYATLEADLNIMDGDRAIIKLDFSAFGEFMKTRTSEKDFKKWANFFNEIDFKTPWTYFKPKEFAIKYSEVLQNSYFKVENGFIDPTGPINLIGSQFSMQEFLNKKMNNLSDNDQKSLEDSIPEKSDGTGIIDQSTGISVYVPGNLLATAIKTNPDAFNLRMLNNTVLQMEDANIDNYIIFGHNIDTGYRVDVAKATVGTKVFYSLCKRQVDYAIDRSELLSIKKHHIFLPEYEDEPWISESAQAGKSGTLYISEELFRWNNWSLTCPQVGNFKTEDEEGKYEFNDLELQNVKPVNKTLLPLRFGQKYVFRMRMVDLCGNSPELEAEGKAITQEKFHIKMNKNETYLRYERVEPAEIFFNESIYHNKVIVKHYKETMLDGSIKKNRYKEIERLLKTSHMGEMLSSLVIRSAVDKTGKITMTQENCIRYIAPPRVTPQLAELHGVFDKPNVLKHLFKILSGEQENFNRLVNFGTKDEPEISFITDPNVKGFFIQIPQFNLQTIPIESDDRYADRKFVRLSLKNGDDTVSIHKNNNKKCNTIEIGLKPGNLIQGNLFPLIGNADFMGNKPVEISTGSKLAPIGEKLTLGLVHAVQRPVYLTSTNSESNVINLTPSDRLPEFPIQIKMKIASGGNLNIPMGTTESFNLVASYRDLIRDPENILGHGYRFDDSRKQVFEFSNIAISENPENITLKIPSLKFSSEAINTQFFKSFDTLSHSFNDTKHRMVTYSLEFESRFKNYFEDGNGDDFFKREFQVLDNGISSHNVKNSQKPKALQIDKIIHILNWEETERFDGQYFNNYITAVERNNKTFRVYFNDEEWFSTGPDEGIAVLYADELDTIEDELNGLVSELGIDPAINQKNTRGSRITVTNGLESRMLGGSNLKKVQTVAGVDVDFIDPRILEKEKSRFTTGNVVVAKKFTEISAKVFPVKYDGKQFYCDIEFFAPVNTYFPFIKFAIARYQEKSITSYEYLPDGKLDIKSYDFRFSNIVMTPQLQVLPKRIIWLYDNGTILFPNGLNMLKKNSTLYLIREFSQDGEFFNLVEENQEQRQPEIEIIPFWDDEYKIKPESLSVAQSAYIEEYEYYEIDGKFTMPEFEIQADGSIDRMRLFKGYNPRNDIRKRLVFNYKIK